MNTSDAERSVLGEIHLIAEELKRRARHAFIEASAYPDRQDFTRRFIEHGATCYVNAADLLDALLVRYEDDPSSGGELDDGLFGERGRLGTTPQSD